MSSFNSRREESSLATETKAELLVRPSFLRRIIHGHKSIVSNFFYQLYGAASGEEVCRTWLVRMRCSDHRAAALSSLLLPQCWFRSMLTSCVLDHWELMMVWLSPFPFLLTWLCSYQYCSATGNGWRHKLNNSPAQDSRSTVLISVSLGVCWQTVPRSSDVVPDTGSTSTPSIGPYLFFLSFLYLD